MASAEKLPRRIVVERCLDSRYPGSVRPVLWPERKAGVERVVSSDGEELSVLCSGGQSSPQAGWELLLTARDENGSYRWTLFGIRPHEAGSGSGAPVA